MKLTDAPASNVDDAEKEFLDNIAKDLIGMLADTERQMARLYYRSHLDQEEMLEVWGQLPSFVRTSIKRGNGQCDSTPTKPTQP
jgi:DNA-directed RNA polymerase specialized sigma subunit